MRLSTLCYVKRDGRTLMLHRVKKEKDINSGKWIGLGGGLEPGESPEEGVVREVFEESGLVIRNPRLRGFLTFPAFEGFDGEYTFVFTATESDGKLKLCDEGDLAWVDDDRIRLLNLWEGDRVFLKWLDGPRFFSAKFSYHGGKFTGYSAAFYDTARGLVSSTSGSPGTGE